MFHLADDGRNVQSKFKENISSEANKKRFWKPKKKLKNFAPSALRASVARLLCVQIIFSIFVESRVAFWAIRVSFWVEICLWHVFGEVWKESLRKTTMGEVHDASPSSFPSTTHTIPSTLGNKIFFDPIFGVKKLKFKL